MPHPDAFFLSALWQGAGLLGALVYISTFLMIALDRLTSCSPLYYLCQLSAASLVMISLLQQFNVAAAVIQLFFMLVSVLGLIRHLKPARTAGTVARA